MAQAFLSARQWIQPGEGLLARAQHTSLVATTSGHPCYGDGWTRAAVCGPPPLHHLPRLLLRRNVRLAGAAEVPERPSAGDRHGGKAAAALPRHHRLSLRRRDHQ